MKKLLLIRHANAVDSFTKSDFERELSEKGKNEIKAVCSKLKNCDFFPDIILVSSAKRTLQTAKILAKNLSWDSIEILKNEDLYNSEFKNILKALNNTPNEINNLAIIAHNPAITEVVNILNNSNFSNLPTSTIAYFEFNAEKWSLIEFKNLVSFKMFSP
ncbi:MAG: histidine phosphatase family protein [Bacteroidetes bacterium]|nr:histidine phosphatase family protein [Bacteroidota bacterium]